MLANPIKNWNATKEQVIIRAQQLAGHTPAELLQFSTEAQSHYPVPAPNDTLPDHIRNILTYEFTSAVGNQYQDRPQGIQIWNREPDQLTWFYRRYICSIRRNSKLGYLCGYVYVSTNHPNYPDFNTIHSYGDTVYFPDPTPHLGFDCGHCVDFAPYLLHGNPDDYKDIFFVQRHCHLIVDQLEAK